MSNSNGSKKMGFNATWSMAVGGMVGGGIFSVLGVVIKSSAQWAWFSFLIAGIIALISAYSYSQLSKKFNESGGSFSFLREINHEGFAGSLSWVLIMGYILTISVYGFTFGHYVANVFSLGSWFPRVMAFSIIAALTFVNLRGVGDSSKVEIITVWGKLFVLVGLAGFGIAQWAPEQLTKGVESKSLMNALTGAATIFMAYEGFQLLSYDYDDIENADKTLPTATLSAVVTVIVIYIIVTLGATMLVGADTIIQKKEIALAVAGQKALGTTGLILVTIAAAFSTGSAINATLFSTSRFMEDVAEKKDLPDLLAKENKENVPYYAILSIAAFSALLAIIGSLSSLVEAASLIFLFTFGTVNYIAFREKVSFRWVCLLGALCTLCAILGSVWHIAQKNPASLITLTVLILFAVIGRPIIIKKIL